MTDDACVEYNQFYNNIHIYETEVAFYCRNATYFSEIANRLWFQNLDLLITLKFNKEKQSGDGNCISDFNQNGLLGFFFSVFFYNNTLISYYKYYYSYSAFLKVHDRMFK